MTEYDHIPRMEYESPFEDFDRLMRFLYVVGATEADCRLIGAIGNPSMRQVWLFWHGPGTQGIKMIAWHRESGT